MESMAKVSNNRPISASKGQFTRGLEANMAFGAITLDRKGGFAIMAGAAGFTMLHGRHTGPLV